jgi:hypothetical protein
MNDDQKLFRVEKVLVPEWGKSTTEFTRYFVATSRHSVEVIVRERFGRGGWSQWDRCETRFEIEEVPVEIL